MNDSAVEETFDLIMQVIPGRRWRKSVGAVDSEPLQKVKLDNLGYTWQPLECLVRQAMTFPKNEGIVELVCVHVFGLKVLGGLVRVDGVQTTVWGNVMDIKQRSQSVFHLYHTAVALH